ncbi:MAG: BolA/IbaG family iron-sulfur metabolism protein [Gammaproteobacteria bacterium]|nr:BolA/IbaG family iron-sulfur metabolism protein [Gammaproteobacteria bacterium]MDD9821976.1 BolA/IbaG family iron-sulfur metabolism protein [Gammaproteobacteria bacterium]MDD9855086.1 BolA/IbaG family iron-sulfur metabolism protein [Gammaproteobacteria bacterium]
MPTPEDIQGWIQAGLPRAEVRVAGDGRHFEAVIVDDGFAGQSLLARHQMVYDALGARMKADIHALSMQTLTPDEHRARGA